MLLRATPSRRGPPLPTGRAGGIEDLRKGIWPLVRSRRAPAAERVLASRGSGISKLPRPVAAQIETLVRPRSSGRPPVVGAFIPINLVLDCTWAGDFLSLPFQTWQFGGIMESYIKNIYIKKLYI